MTTVADISRRVGAVKDATITLRRQFHQYPEIAYEETRTAELVVKGLKALGLSVEQGIGVTGVVGVLEGARPGKTLYIRADMDALPMAETAGRPYGSKIENRNHACGHDMDMALALGTAMVLTQYRQEIAGRIAFVFQPADEPQTGAQRMIDDGLLEKIRPDIVLGHHPLPALRSGQVVVPTGTVWTSIDTLHVTIQGQDGWFAGRDDGIDCALIAAQLVSDLYALVHNESPLFEPVLFNVNSLQGGQRRGAILDRVELEMSLAVYRQELRQKLLGRIREAIDAGVKSRRGTYTLETVHSLPPAVNDPAVTQAVVNAARQVVGEGNVIQDWRNIFPDDVAVFMAHAPGCVFMMGTANPDKGIVHDWHTPSFDIDEDTLPLGVEIMVRAALELLK